MIVGRKTLLIALCLITGTVDVPAQNQNNDFYKSVSIASPSAASLGQYVDQPVNYSVGLPDISLPLYEVTEGPLKLPISLSYYPQGVKVLQPASWVGMNWSLFAGGVITRTVRGTPDEKGTGTSFSNAHGYYSNYGISGDGIVTFATGNPNRPEIWGWDWVQISAGNKDGEPDFYTFSMPGYSGKFCFRDDRQPVFFPDQDIKIEVDYPGTGSIQSFILTVPDGTRYYFGKTPATNDIDPIEVTKVSNEINGTALGNIASSWFLNKIESADRLFSINLVYEQERYSFLGLSFNSMHEANMYTFDYDLIKTIVLGVRLRTIQYSNGRVEFVPGPLREDLTGFSTYVLNEEANTEAKSLSAITVYKADNTVLKSFGLSTSYFVDNSSPLNGTINTTFPSFSIDKKRLKLVSVTESNSLGQTLPPTTFEYYTEPVTRRLSFGQDHWGYANGVTSNAKMIPTYTENTYTVIAGANRDPAWPQMRGGSLKRINHPTGGYTEFEMEANTVWLTKSGLADVFAISKQVSYTASQTSPASVFANLPQGQHKITLSSTGGTETAYATVRNGTTLAVIISVYATPGQTTSALFNIPTAGNYKLEVQKSFTTSGNGATATLYSQQYVDQSENAMCGGLRVKTITKVDNGPNPDVVTSFDYTYNNKSTAALYGIPVYVQVLRNDLIKKMGYFGSHGYKYHCSFNGCFTCDAVPGARVAFYKSAGSVRAMDQLQGSHIGYAEVKVSQTGNGHRILRFYSPLGYQMEYRDVVVRNVITNTCDANVPNYPEAPLPFDYKRGELKSELTFNQNGELLKQVDYSPYYDSIATNTVPGVIEQVIAFGPGVLKPMPTIPVGTNWVVITGTFYELGSRYKKYLATFSRELVPGAGYIDKFDTTFYTSAFHRQPTAMVTIGSNAVREEKKIKYAADFRNAACDGISDCSSAYTTAVNACSTQYLAAFNACSGADTGICWAVAHGNYQKCLQTARTNWAVTCRQNYLNPASSTSYPYCQTNARNNATGDLKPVYHLRDIYANPPVEITGWTAGKLTSAQYIAFTKEDANGYIIPPDKDYRLPQTAGLTNFSPAYVSGNSLVKDSRYVQENDIDLYQGLLRTVTSKDGSPQSYLWDATRTYPVAVATGATEADIAFTSFEDGAKGSFVYAGTPTLVTAAPFPPTGKYYLALNGSTSVLSRAVANGAVYTLSYWRNSATAFAITGGTVQSTQTGATINGWTFFEHKILATATTLAINQAGSIDEVRLYPYGATMKSFTYYKPVGIATQTDERGAITYYEYDAFNRLLQVKDMRGIVLRRMEYLMNQTY